MGCGASAGPPVPQSPPARYKEEKEEDVFSGKGPKAKAKRKSQKKKAAEAKDIEWHNKNCQDVQFEKVKTVREAYPFDERKKKTVHKRENVRSGGIDDVLKADNWGSVEISDIGPLRLLYNLARGGQESCADGEIIADTVTCVVSSSWISTRIPRTRSTCAATVNDMTGNWSCVFGVSRRKLIIRKWSPAQRPRRKHWEGVAPTAAASRPLWAELGRFPWVRTIPQKPWPRPLWTML